MIVLWFGDVGSGKTLLQTKQLHEDFKKGRKILSNYGLSFDHQILTPDDIKDYSNWEYNNMSVALDEVHVYMDSRLSMNKRNRVMGYWFTQSRKRGVDIYMTTQFPHQVDKRVKGVCDYLIECQSYKTRPLKQNAKYNNNGKLEDLYIVYRIFHVYSQTWKEQTIVYANPYFNLYDSYQVIKPPEHMEDKALEKLSKEK